MKREMIREFKNCVRRVTLTTLIGISTSIALMGLVEGLAFGKTSTKTTTDKIAAYVGEDFDVTLASNPTTGYGWEVVADAKIIKFNGEQFTPSGSGIGSGGQSKFSFTPLTKGTTVLTFLYKRSWEADVILIKTFIVSIKARQPINIDYTIQVGEKLDINLSSNPSTGYQWQIAKIDNNVINFLEETFTPDGTAIGSGGTQNFIFEGVAKGLTTIEFVYKRSWEKNGIDQRKFVVRVD